MAFSMGARYYCFMLHDFDLDPVFQTLIWLYWQWLKPAFEIIGIFIELEILISHDNLCIFIQKAIVNIKFYTVVFLFCFFQKWLNKCLPRKFHYIYFLQSSLAWTIQALYGCSWRSQHLWLCNIIFCHYYL